MKSLQPWPLLIAGLTLGCGQHPQTPPAAPKKLLVGGDFPISAARLTNAWLDSISDDPAVEWTFKETEFMVSSGAKPLPKNLAEPLLGAGVSATKVKGKWQFDAVKSEVVLTDLTSGDRKGMDKALLPIAPAGMVRVNLGTLQYNIMPLDKRPMPEADAKDNP